MAPWECPEQVSVFVLGGCTHQLPLGADNFVSGHRIVHEPAYMRMGSHAERHHQTAQRGVLHFDRGFQLQPHVPQTARNVPYGREWLESDHTSIVVHA